MKTTGDQVLAKGATSDASTRSLVMLSILQNGPSTASELASRLELTAAAVRRHLGVLEEIGHLNSRQQRTYGARGRGRPALVFELTDAGRAVFPSSYDAVAIAALSALAAEGGPQAIDRFADGITEAVAQRYAELRPDFDSSVEALVQALTDEGFVATLKPIPTGQQLCLYHCPVSHVAAAFPQLCAAEARVFGQLLDSHVQQLATIAHGDGVCTTHIPRPVTPEDHTSSRKVAS